MNAIAARKLAQQTWTYADYVTWDEEVRGELIDGVFYDMSPGPSYKHQDVAGGVYAQLRQQLRGKPCRPYIAPADVVLLNEHNEDSKARNVVQPDAFIVCDQSKLAANILRGAPDWVLEVLSPHTSRKDQVRKLDLYERAGVREYWLLQPDERVLTIYTQEAAVRYGRPRVIEAIGATALAILPDVVIDWIDIYEDEPTATVETASAG